jgi:hypothetical protein
MYILSYAHISFKINMSLTENVDPKGTRPTVWECLVYIERGHFAAVPSGLENAATDAVIAQRGNVCHSAGSTATSYAQLSIISFMKQYK